MFPRRQVISRYESTEASAGGGDASSPLWGARVVVGQGVGDPIVLDTTGVTLYIGNAKFDADVTTKFDTNESRFRLESPVLLVISQPDAIHVVSSS